LITYCRFWADLPAGRQEIAVLRPAFGWTKDWLVWKLLENSFADLPAELAGARGEAPSEAGNRNFTNWLSVLNKIRTFFRENPDADF